jgi:hypothetical protein
MNDLSLVDVLRNSPPVIAFNSALAAFESQHRSLDDQLARAGQTRFSTRSRLGSSGAAVIAFCRPLLDAHVEAAVAWTQSWLILSEIPRTQFPESPTEEGFRAWAEEQTRILGDFEKRNGRGWHDLITQSNDISKVPLATLDACYQSYFYLLRAYQDRAYSVLLEVMGDNSGPKVSMSKIIERDGSFKGRYGAGSTLAERCPRYGEWFVRFKKMRDDLKFGAPTSTWSYDFDIGIGIGNFDDERESVALDVCSRYGLRNVVEALAHSGELISTIQAISEERFLAAR